jgi:hypothetical protein
MQEPRGDETPIVDLLHALDELVPRYADDFVLREPVAQILNATLALLNGPIGRLDGGMVWDVVERFAHTMHYNLDVEEFE